MPEVLAILFVLLTAGGVGLVIYGLIYKTPGGEVIEVWEVTHKDGGERENRCVFFRGRCNHTLLEKLRAEKFAECRRDLIVNDKDDVTYVIITHTEFGRSRREITINNVRPYEY